ncbi:hypothetical protein HY546_02885 [archaeon]|nr:hypothetical protein [archaeon]
MGFTQIVRVSDRKEELKKSLQRISTKKIVFLADNESLEKVLRLRNELALDYDLPTEVRNTAEEDISSVLKEYDDVVVHIVDHHDDNYELISRCHLFGIPLYFSNGQNFRRIPTPPVRFMEMFSPVQIEIFHSLAEAPLTLPRLAEKTSIMELTLYNYLHGKDSAKGLVQLGFVEKKEDYYALSEFTQELLKL